MSDSVRIENWSVVADQSDPFKAPEARPVCLHGKAYGHPNFDDGAEITTSPILGVSPENPREIRTHSRVYLLGEVDPGYVEYRSSIGLGFDPDHPVVFGKK